MVQRSGIARRALQGSRHTGRPFEAVGDGAEPDGFGAVIALVADELARVWTKQTRKRGPTLTTANRAVLEPTSEEIRWKR
jgi:hypothetical protein